MRNAERGTGEAEGRNGFRCGDTTNYNRGNAELGMGNFGMIPMAAFPELSSFIHHLLPLSSLLRIPFYHRFEMVQSIFWIRG